MTIWDLFFMQICSWRLHPGYLKPGVEPPSLEECAELADAMLAERNRRWQCQHGQPER